MKIKKAGQIKGFYSLKVTFLFQKKDICAYKINCDYVLKMLIVNYFL